MRPADTWTSGAGFRDLLDLMSDAVLVLDRQARITFANSAALRALPCEAGLALADLRNVLGAAAIEWVHQCVLTASPAHLQALPSPVKLPDGRMVQIAWQPLEGRRSVVRLQIAAPERLTVGGGVQTPHVAIGSASTAALLQAFWNSAFPTTLQDASFRLVDVNQAFLDFSGYRREQVIGLDPLALQPKTDPRYQGAVRARLAGEAGEIDLLHEPDRLLLDAQGRELSFRMAQGMVLDEPEGRFYLGVLHDTTAERAAREVADRSARELDQWFDLTPVGMLLYDHAGLLVRRNASFASLVGSLPPLMNDAPPTVQALLGWVAGAPEAALLQAGGSAIAREAWLADADGAPRRLRATIGSYLTPGGQRRFMAVVQDHSMQDQRDLARLQVGALMDTAGVGLATFQASSGWVHQGASTRGVHAESAALQSISREIVLASSLPDYDRLQDALRQAQRAEVRYAIQHPELGERWLLTRVEPAHLASGERTTSVVTLDVTEQQQSQARSEQLLREMSTILESSTAGIALLRGNTLVRCNQRFEAMLGLGGGLAGRPLNDVFPSSPQGQRIAADTLQALLEGVIYETEFELAADIGTGTDTPRWYALSVRRTGSAQPDGPIVTWSQIEAIAVLSDITRLKAQQKELELLARDRELMFSLSEVGIAFLRHDRIQRANDALAQLSGYPAFELAGLPQAALFPESDEPADAQAREESALRQLGRWIGERRLRRGDGRSIWVQVSKRLVVDGDPVGGVIASYVNVDDRHRAEQALTLQAERTRAILDSVLVGIVTVGPNGIEWMNRSARRMFGGELLDFVNQSIAMLATDDAAHPLRVAREPADAADQDEATEPRAESFECRVRALDGREFWVVGNAVLTGRDASGWQLTYALLDIESRRRAEAETAQARASLQRIIEATPMAITLRDAHSLRVLQINEAAARSVGIEQASLVGRTPEQVYSPEGARARRRDMEATVAGRAMTHAEYTWVLDGVTQIWDVRYIPLIDASHTGPDSAPDQLLQVATDVTAQRAAQEARYEAAIAQREMLVKEVHHRIKNNLQGVAGLLQQIGARKPEIGEAIAEVIGQVQAIAQVYGLQVGMDGPLRVKSVVEAINSSVQKTFGATITLALVGQGPHRWALPEAEAIPIALTINELLTNAIKHSAQHGRPGTVACQLACDATAVRLIIANPGQLPAGFSLARFPGGVSGLGLVRALLPRRHATLTLEQDAEQVVATITLVPPCVLRLDAD